MTPAEFKERMQKIKDEDIYTKSVSGSGEKALQLMFECLRSLGYGEGCDIYEQIEKWYA